MSELSPLLGRIVLQNPAVVLRWLDLSDGELSKFLAEIV
jgi:hypothetical protein